MKFARSIALAIATIVFSAPGLAHHPGVDLDKVMGKKEQYFQAIDSPAPPFDLSDADGNIVRLSDFDDKVIILNFIFANCTDVCPLHSELIARVQSMINTSPMEAMVQFITVTTDPESDTPEILRRYGEAHGLDSRNWKFLTRRPGDPEDVTRSLSQAYNVIFEPLDGGQQMHGVATHVIDRGGRLAAKFHGLRFEPLNLVLYINGLTNAQNQNVDSAEPSWWENLKGLFQ